MYIHGVYMAFKRRRHAKRRGGQKLSRKQKNEVKRLIDGSEELKALNTSVLGSITAGGSITPFTMPSQGLGLSERIGDQIKVHRIKLLMDLVAGDATNIVRYIIFRWSQNNSIVANFPTVGDVLQTSSTLSFYNWTSMHSGKLHICYDRVFPMTLGSDSGLQIVEHDLVGRRLGRKILDFNATLTSGTDQFYLLTISDSIAAPHPSIGGYVQLQYTDA